MARYIFQGAAESTQGTTVDPIDELDNAFQPSVQQLSGAKRDKNVTPLKEDDGELIYHDEAHGVFRSPRPSITFQDLQDLQKMQEYELKRRSGGASSGQATTRHPAVRGGSFGGSRLNDLWLAQEGDLGADSGLYAEGAVLGAEEAYQAWEAAAREKYESEIDWWDECVFSESEAEDITSGDSGCMLR